MPVPATDVLIKLTTKAGAAGNSQASTPSASLGKYISTTQIVDNTSHNLFDQISGEENAAGESEYRCLAVHNANGAAAIQNVKVFLLSEVAGGASVAIGVDPTAASVIGSAAAQGLEVADENTAPAGVVFSSPATLGAAIALGDIPAGQCRFFWVRRTATNSAGISNDGVTFRVAYESV